VKKKVVYLLMDTLNEIDGDAVVVAHVHSTAISALAICDPRVLCRDLRGIAPAYFISSYLIPAHPMLPLRAMDLFTRSESK